MQNRLERTGDWLQTYTGKQFWPIDPRPEEIESLDIAHALSQLCRYGGHTNRFYSVAEHCWLMSHAVSPENALWALLHDATEAYLCDLPRPLKRMMPDYSIYERRLMISICMKYNLLSLTEPEEVKEADNRILIDERARLMADHPVPWINLEPLGVQVWGWAPKIAEQKYLERLFELTKDPTRHG